MSNFQSLSVGNQFSVKHWFIDYYDIRVIYTVKDFLFDWLMNQTVISEWKNLSKDIVSSEDTGRRRKS